MRCAAVVLMLVGLGTAPVVATESGAARGIVTVKGTPAALTHAVARVDQREAGAFTVVTLSTVPLTRAEAGDAATLTTRAKKGELVAVEVAIEDSTGIARPQVIFAQGAGGRAVADVVGLWSSKEFTDQIAEGQLKSDGVLDEDTKAPWSYDADFRVVLPGNASAELAYGEASGTLTLQGKSVEISHVRSWVVNDEVGEGTGTRVVLSNQPVDLASAQSEETLWALVESDGLVAVSVLIDDESGNVDSQTFYAQGLPIRLSTGVGSSWSKWEFTTDVVRGSVTSGGPQDLFDLTWEYEIFLAAEIE